VWQTYQATQIASDSIQTFYYSDYNTTRNHVVGAIPHVAFDEHEHRAPPRNPIYYAMPRSDSMIPTETYYSEAPLSGVHKVRLCMEGDYCIGLLLQYDSYSRSVGHFRYDKIIRYHPDKPSYIAVRESRQDNKVSVHVEFPNEPIVRAGYHCQPMIGRIVWWYSREISDVSCWL
jgi:hypothetical protein